MRKKKGSGKKKVNTSEVEEKNFNYEISESESDFDAAEQDLLNRRRGTSQPEPEEEVFGINVSSDDEEDDDSDESVYGGGVGSDYDSDIQDSKKTGDDEEDGLPNARAWGSRKKSYYNTDYVDNDYGGMREQEEDLAELEETEAAKIQQRLMASLEETDFTMGLLDKVKEKKTELAVKEVETVEAQSEKISTDLSKLSKREKVHILKQESPELFQLVDDFKEKMELVRDKLSPMVKLIKDGVVKQCPASQFVTLYHSIILNYCTNITYYLMLKSLKRGSLDSHPVVKRLYTYKKLLDEMQTAAEDKLMSQVDAILKTGEGIELADETEEGSQPPANRAERRKRKLKILEEQKVLEKEAEKKKIRLEAGKGQDIVLPEESEEEEELEEAVEEEEDEGEDSDNKDEKGKKRAITREIAKNRGLTPWRKKENRNPRVKNRNKYKKAIIRRKGQVRTVRNEAKKYDGEYTGIKAFTVKSVKYKY